MDNKENPKKKIDESTEKRIDGELTDEELDISGGVIAITTTSCPACGNNPCTCSSFVV